MKKKFIRCLILPVLAVFLSACADVNEYTAQTGYGTEACDVVQENEPGDGISGETREDAPESAKECVVHIGGAVAKPGVYHLPDGSRLIDAIDLAGGLTEEAYADGCNLAEVLTDGLQYRIPTREEAVSLSTGGSPGTSSYTSDGKLDINRASEEELMQLSGIGKTRAQAIVSYREEHGKFASPEEIKQVSGIGDAVFAAIQGDITVR